MPKLKSCSKCRRRPRRDESNSYCRECHAKESRAFRKKQREQMDALMRMAARYGEPVDL